MSDGVKPFLVMIRDARTDAVRTYLLPVDAAVMVTDLIHQLGDLEDSREVQADAVSSLFRAASGGVAGWVGPFLEVRKLPTDSGMAEAVTEACSETDPERMCAECKKGYAEMQERGESRECPVDCTCIFCIPGA